MMQVAIVGFLASGALLSMAYYDVFVVLLALSGRLRLLLRESENAVPDPAANRWRRPAPA